MFGLQEILGYKFNDEKLLNQALTHSSYTTDIHRNYERLEFLGDRVLGVAVAHMLYSKFPNEPEGNLSQRHTTLVCKETVAEVVKKLGINKFIIAENEETKNSINVLCDVGEAIIGAIYIDSSLKNATQFVEKHWYELVEKYKNPPKDSKTLLQEIAWKMNLGNPEYVIEDKSGSEHMPIFTIAVCLGKKFKASGKGHNKKAAEQEAAKNMLEKIGYLNESK